MEITYKANENFTKFSVLQIQYLDPMNLERLKFLRTKKWLDETVYALK